MHEVKIRLIAQAREQFRVAEGYRIPAHVRDFQTVGANFFDVAAENFQPVDAGTFLTAREQNLQADANAENFFAARDFALEFGNQARCRKIFHAVAEGTDARQNNFFGAFKVVDIARNFHVTARSFDGFGDAVQIADAVVNQNNHVVTSEKFQLAAITFER